jgi:glycosyltransferase involved in cell wall biosynthesis
MKKKPTVLVVAHTIVNSNPALAFVVSCLQNEFEVKVCGNESSSKYEGYSRLDRIWRILLLLRFELFVKLISIIFAWKNWPSLHHKLLLHVNLYLAKRAFNFTYKSPVDFIINLDTEAALISSQYQKRYSLPCAYFIYEFYAEQVSQQHNYNLLLTLERMAISQASFLLSPANKVLGNRINERFGLSKHVVPFTITPSKGFGDEEAVVSSPLKIYYHGYFVENRGIDNAILAMKNTKSCVLYLRGSGPFAKVLRSLVVEHGLEQKVIFLAPVATENLVAEAAKFDVGITLARMNVQNHAYATGFKTFENICAGIALIIPDSVPLRHLNDRFDLGYVYADGTVEELTQAFEFCVNNTQIVSRWKRNARTAFVTEYNQKIQSSRLANEIKHVLDQRLQQ